MLKFVGRQAGGRGCSRLARRRRWYGRGRLDHRRLDHWGRRLDRQFGRRKHLEWDNNGGRVHRRRWKLGRHDQLRGGDGRGLAQPRGCAGSHAPGE
jgi:hypothetical protein